MNATNGKAAIVRNDIDALVVSSWKQEVCHTLDRNHDAKVEGRVALAVVVLSTVVGGSIFATLSTSPQTWIKAVVGGVSLLSAVLAAVNQWAPFAGRSKGHATAASAFSNVHEKARQLERELDLGHLTPDAASEQLKGLEGEYARDEGDAPADDHYSQAEIWVERQLAQHPASQLRVPQPTA